MGDLNFSRENRATTVMPPKSPSKSISNKFVLEGRRSSADRQSLATAMGKGCGDLERAASSSSQSEETEHLMDRKGSNSSGKGAALRSTVQQGQVVRHRLVATMISLHRTAYHLA